MIVRLTESELINVVRKVISEQTQPVPSDTIVVNVGTKIKIGIKNKSAKIYKLKLPIIGTTDVVDATIDHNSDFLTIKIKAPYGFGTSIGNRLNADKSKLSQGGITVTKSTETGCIACNDFYKFKIDLKKNKKVATAIISARKGSEFIKLTDDVSLSVN